jgi:hypothetical protein
MLSFRAWFEVNYPKELDDFDPTDYAGREASIQQRMKDHGEDWFTAGSARTAYPVRRAEIIKAWYHIVKTLFPGGEFHGDLDKGPGNVVSYHINMGPRGVSFSLNEDKYGRNLYATVDFGWEEMPGELSQKDADNVSGGNANVAAKSVQPGSMTFMRTIERYAAACQKYGIRFMFNSSDEGDTSRRTPVYGKILNRAGYEPVPSDNRRPNSHKPRGSTY